MEVIHRLNKGARMIGSGGEEAGIFLVQRKTRRKGNLEEYMKWKEVVKMMMRETGKRTNKRWKQKRF